MVSGFSVSRADDDGRVVLVVRGELDMATAPVLRQTLADLRASEVHLDTSGLTFVDSTGLSALLATNRRWQEEDRTLRLLNPSRTLRRLLQMAGVEQVFQIDDA